MLIYVDVLIFSKSYSTACLSRASRIRWPLISAAERSWTPAGLGFRLDFPGKSPWRTGIPVKREFFEISPTSEKQLSECVFVNALVLALKKIVIWAYNIIALITGKLPVTRNLPVHVGGLVLSLY